MSSSLARVVLVAWSIDEVGGHTTTHVTILKYLSPLCLLLWCAASICSSTHIMTTDVCLDGSSKRNKEGGRFHYNLGGGSIVWQTIYTVCQYCQIPLQLQIQKQKDTESDHTHQFSLMGLFWYC
jgi:hypothetical protein